ncbi:protein LYRIC isoform X1 [Salmo salar]|uniref:Protein LYRIC isoform X1 n=1 Tax=Salmo salar TaxID=8030 RepID=A0A1S3RWZ6_SALSA|nr:protein LYRIC-like isoform X1 [Salmo salar]|eukprot:XP_014056771.1 PREDICTED: protein LYRIC-like isoform X1 [Salmo salar]
MAENWQDATSQQVKLIAGRLNELLSTGLDLLHSELGVDFGVKPEIPPWLIFLAACIGLVLMVAMWASACRGLLKKRPTIIEVETVESTKLAPIKVAKAEEPKKKKRKPTEKKSQPNGSVVAELQEEVRATEEDNLPVVPHHSPQIKTEKASEVKKTKKKPKQAVKEAKTASSHGKESEEVSGTWETKISNKEKREQRRKDKTTGDGSGSPGGVDPLHSTPPTESTKASPKAAAPGSCSEKKEKKKGESSKTKAEKADAAVAEVRPQAISSEEAPVVTGERPDLAVTAQEAPALTIVPDEGHWTTSESNQDTAVWGQETEEPQLLCPSQPKPQVEDESSGLNGEGSADAADGGSAWNNPGEGWGNYGELPAPVGAALEEPLPETVKQVSDEERETAEPAADGTGKSKKKKKKKKKPAEDAVVTGQESEEPSKKVVTEAKVKKQPIQEPAAPTVQAVNAAAVKARVEQPVVVQNTAPITQVPPQPAETKPTAKQNSLPAPTHKKPEESQPSKPVMKKKRARRET